MTKLAKMAAALNDEFRETLANQMKVQYGVEIETHWNFMANQIVSTRIDDQEFTPDQMDFMKAFEAGYTAAMIKVRNAAADR